MQSYPGGFIICAPSTKTALAIGSCLMNVKSNEGTKEQSLKRFDLIGVHALMGGGQQAAQGKGCAF